VTVQFGDPPLFLTESRIVVSSPLATECVFDSAILKSVLFFLGVKSSSDVVLIKDEGKEKN
jgi:hypothetical protein